MVAFLAVGADAVVVELGSEVVESGLGVRQQVSDDDQDRAADDDKDRAADRDDGLLLPTAVFFPTAAGDASIASPRKVSVLAAAAASPRTRAR
jgi:hypothetical protein